MASAHKDPVILFFLAGAIPTATEMQEIWELGSNVRHRNGSIHDGGSAPEQCDGVAGAVPEAYRKFKDGHSVLKAARESTLDRLQDIEDGAAETSRLASEKELTKPEEKTATETLQGAQAGGKQPKPNPAAAWSKQ